MSARRLFTNYVELLLWIGAVVHLVAGGVRGSGGGIDSLCALFLDLSTGGVAQGSSFAVGFQRASGGGIHRGIGCFGYGATGCLHGGAGIGCGVTGRWLDGIGVCAGGIGLSLVAGRTVTSGKRSGKGNG